MDQIKSTGNSWADVTTLSGATKHGVAEPVTQFATAVVTITSSGGGELVIERGRTVASLTEVQVISLTAATKKTVTILACETLLRVSLRNTTASPTISTVETFFYDQLFTPSATYSTLGAGASSDRLLVDVAELSQAGPTVTTALPRMGIYGQVQGTSNWKPPMLSSNGQLIVNLGVGRLPSTAMLWSAAVVYKGENWNKVQNQPPSQGLRARNIATSRGPKLVLGRHPSQKSPRSTYLSFKTEVE